MTRLSRALHLVLPTLLFASTALAAPNGIWQAGNGEYWIPIDNGKGTAYALSMDSKLSGVNVWSGTASSSGLALSSAGTALTVSQSGNKLSGTLGSQNFSATQVGAHIGSSWDGAYLLNNGRYLALTTVLFAGKAATVGVEITVGSKLTPAVFWGSVDGATSTFSGTQIGGSTVLSLTFDSAGAGSGSRGSDAVTASKLLGQPLSETSMDYLNYGQTTTSYTTVTAKGAKIVNLAEEKSFFTWYVPPTVDKGRIMVVVHGTGGTGYDEVKDELDFAAQYGYIPLGIQWLDKSAGTYFSGEQVYRIITKALNHLKNVQGYDLSRVSYVGFSRGSAVSYEVTWRDLQANKFFDLTISHSGGIPLTLAVAPGESTNPDVFFSNLTKGTLGATAMQGSNFFFYCGEKDEQWGAEMCQQINNANTQITKFGGTVVKLIADPNGTHAGYRLNSSYHTQGVTSFMTLTP